MDRVKPFPEPLTLFMAGLLGWIAKFRDVLHEAVESGLRDGVDDIQINGAIQTQEGWMHIHGACRI